MNVLHVTRCIGASRAYGGFNRSQQILGILSRQGIPCASIDLFAEGFGGRVANLRAGLALALRPGFPAPSAYQRWWIAGHYHHLLSAALARNPGVRPVLIWENTADDLLAHAAVQLGLKVIATPHDLVTLNRPVDSDTWPDFAREVRGLDHSSAVFTISQEERWLLRLLGCPSGWLPYFPPETVGASLLQVRAQRRPAKDAPILLLGSTSNPQTRAGLEHQLQLLKAAGMSLGRKVVLAGNGTPDLAPLAGDHVEVRGAVTDAELATLMAQSAVLWTYQAAGTGALTRVSEALLAGLPVAGGGVALRSTAHLADVYPAETVSALRELLPSLPAVAAQPLPPVEAEREFVEKVRTLAS